MKMRLKIMIGGALGLALFVPREAAFAGATFHSQVRINDDLSGGWRVSGSIYGARTAPDGNQYIGCALASTYAYCLAADATNQKVFCVIPAERITYSETKQVGYSFYAGYYPYPITGYSRFTLDSNMLRAAASINPTSQIAFIANADGTCSNLAVLNSSQTFEVFEPTPVVEH